MGFMYVLLDWDKMNFFCLFYFSCACVNAFYTAPFFIDWIRIVYFVVKGQTERGGPY